MSAGDTHHLAGSATSRPMIRPILLTSPSAPAASPRAALDLAPDRGHIAGGVGAVSPPRRSSGRRPPGQPPRPTPPDGSRRCLEGRPRTSAAPRGRPSRSATRIPSRRAASLRPPGSPASAGQPRGCCSSAESVPSAPVPPLRSRMLCSSSRSAARIAHLQPRHPEDGERLAPACLPADLLRDLVAALGELDGLDVPSGEMRARAPLHQGPRDGAATGRSLQEGRRALGVLVEEIRAAPHPEAARRAASRPPPPSRDPRPPEGIPRLRQAVGVGTGRDPDRTGPAEEQLCPLEAVLRAGVAEPRRRTGEAASTAYRAAARSPASRSARRAGSRSGARRARRPRRARAPGASGGPASPPGLRAVPRDSIQAAARRCLSERTARGIWA